MKEEYLHYPANYFTATINEWKPALANDNYKDIIIGNLLNLVSKNRIELNAFPDSYLDEQSHSSDRSDSFGRLYKVSHQKWNTYAGGASIMI